MGHHVAHIDLAVADKVDGPGVHIRPQVRAENIQLLAVTDDRPIHRGLVIEHAEFHKASQLAQHRQALVHRLVMPGRLDINVAAVAIGDFADLRQHIHLGRVPHFIGAQAQGEGGAFGFHVQHDEFFRVAQPHRADDAQAQGAGAGDHHDVVMVDVGAFRRV